MRKRGLLLLAVLGLLFSTAFSESALRGWEAAAGYVYVTLGAYPQTVDGGAPEENNNTWRWNHQVLNESMKDWIANHHLIMEPDGKTLTKEPILWRVLTVSEDQAVLLSEYVLFAMPMHRDIAGYRKLGKDFADTELCAYLNGEFAADAFTEEELSMLAENGRKGRIFLLTSAQVKDKSIGLGEGEGMKALATEYALRVTGVFVYKIKHGGHSCYWVQEQSTSDDRHARCTKEKGTLGHLICDRDNEGVRPVVWLQTDRCEITGGTGTKSDPYVLIPKEDGTNE